jgi:hypothetical protein
VLPKKKKKERKKVTNERELVTLGFKDLERTLIHSNLGARRGTEHLDGLDFKLPCMTLGQPCKL